MNSFLALWCCRPACAAMLAMQLLCNSSNAQAASPEGTEPAGALTLSNAIDAALKQNPELQVTSYELKAADARITQAGLRPNPELALNLENFAGTGQARGKDSLETTLSLSQVIELGGKRNYRVSVASVDRELSVVERQAQQLEVLAEVTRRYIDIAVAQQVVVLAQRASALAEQTLAVIAKRVEAARSPQAEQSRAAIALTRARIEQQQAENALQAARRSLAALWGSRAPTFTNVTADLFSLPALQTFDQLSAELQRTPDFLRFVTEARLRDAELRLAQAQARPDLNVSLGVRRFESNGNGALVAGISMPLPISNRNQGAIREAEVRREQLRVQSQAAQLQAEATLFGIYQALLSARNSVTTLRNEAIPQAEAALTQIQTGYERGRFSYLELAVAQQELIALQRNAIDAAAESHRLIAEIERLTSEPLVE